VEEIKSKYIKGLKFHYVEDMEEVISIALLKQKVKKPIKFDLD
jgi:ATP-dependent Lon protease